MYDESPGNIVAFMEVEGVIALLGKGEADGDVVVEDWAMVGRARERERERRTGSFERREMRERSAIMLRN